jgi:hypothetical protein
MTSPRSSSRDEDRGGVVLLRCISAIRSR